jgi:hypothetical protein
LSVIEIDTSISRQIGGSLSSRSMRAWQSCQETRYSRRSCRQFGRLVLPVPRQQFAEAADRMPAGHAVDDVGEVNASAAGRARFQTKLRDDPTIIPEEQHEELVGTGGAIRGPRASSASHSIRQGFAG